jgi:hypothetical protein
MGKQHMKMMELMMEEAFCISFDFLLLSPYSLILIINSTSAPLSWGLPFSVQRLTSYSPPPVPQH